MRIEDTVFTSSRPASYAIVTYSPSDNVSVSHCQFLGDGLGASFSATDGVKLSDSVFSCALVNIMFNGSVGVVERCVTTDGVGQAVVVGDNSEVQLVDSEFNGWYTPLTVHSGSIVDASACIFSGGLDHPTIYIYSTSQVNLHGCHILNGGNYSVKLEYFSQQNVIQDLTGNYWGTTDTSQIDQWIWDGHDNAAVHSVVNYMPILDGPVQTESTTWGAVKSLFR
jgi:hypothetical protein